MTNSAHRPSSGDLFPCLDGVRGLAVLSVVVYHTVYFNSTNPIFKIFQSLIRAGWMGVPIFFVLSGFLISYTVFKASDSFDPLAYVARRLAKIAPPFLLSLLAFTLLLYFWKQPTHLLASVLASLTTLTHFPAAADGLVLINPVYWSLHIEIHFYVLFPLIYFALRRISNHAEWWTFTIFLVVPALFRFSYRPSPELPVETWLLYSNLIPRALDNFALGILFSILFLRFRENATLRSLAPFLATGGVLLLIASYFAYGFLQWKHAIHGNKSVLIFEVFRYLPALGTFGLLFIVYTRPTLGLHRVLSSSVLGFLGLISYEWFLFHQPPVDWLKDVLGNAEGNIGVYLQRTLAPLLITLLVSALVYFFISAPLINGTKNWLKRRALFTREKPAG